MHHDLLKYYTRVELEIFQLMDFHEKCITDKIQAGMQEPQYTEMITTFGMLRKIINKRTSGRKLLAQKLEERDASLMYDRTHVRCPICNILREVIIVGEGRHPNTGFLCDNIKCSFCSNEFMNDMPNNHDDQTKHFESEIKNLKEMFKNVVYKKLFPEMHNEIPTLIEEIKILKKSEQKRKRIMEKTRLFAIEGEARMANLRDELLAMQANGVNTADLGKYLN